MTKAKNDPPATRAAGRAGAEQRLKELDITLPPPPTPFGTYAEAVQTGSLLFLSGMLPTARSGPAFVGRVGAELDAETAARAARLAALNALALRNEGLGANWKTRRAFWADRAANEAALRTNLLSLATTRTRHVGNDPNVGVTTPICGPTNSRSSTDRGRRTFRATSSTTTVPTSTRIPGGRPGCARGSRVFW